MKRILLWLSIGVAVVLALLFYSNRPATNLNITPDAQRAIDKARRR